MIANDKPLNIFTKESLMDGVLLPLGLQLKMYVARDSKEASYT